MLLTEFVGGNVSDYIEFGWVTAPNAAGQPIAANVFTTLSCTNLVVNTSTLSIAAPVNNSRFTLPSGTYYFEAHTRATAVNLTRALLSLYDVTNTSYIRRGGALDSFNSYGANTTINWTAPKISSTIVVPSSTTYELRLLTPVNSTVTNDDSYNGASFSTVSTANTDQRTTIKLWKLK